MKTVHSNNFDFLRLLFASLVIVSHSYPLTGKPEFFAEITNGQLGLGGFSVECFFIMSGYLIFISLKNSKTILSYLWKRVLRLYPALLGLLLVTAVLLTAVSGRIDFPITKQFLQYCVDVLSLYKVNYRIDPLFENNPYPYAINGSLWSLCYEFTMYLTVGAFFWIKNQRIVPYLVGIIFLGSALLYLSQSTLGKDFFMGLRLDIAQLYKLTAYFFAGSLLSFIPLKKYNSLTLRSVLFVMLLTSLFLNAFKVVSVMVLPLFILLVGNASTPYLNSVAKKTGDLSYGIYIYGFLVQQTLIHYFHLDTWPLTILCLILSGVLAYSSWHLIEKKMVKYKNLL